MSSRFLCQRKHFQPPAKVSGRTVLSHLLAKWRLILVVKKLCQTTEKNY